MPKSGTRKRLVSSIAARLWSFAAASKVLTHFKTSPPQADEYYTGYDFYGGFVGVLYHWQ